MFDISWKFHLKYSVTITVPGMEERPSEFLWEEQLNTAGMQLMGVPIHCGHFPFIFFLVLCLERSSLAVVKLCHIQESLGDLFTTQSAGPHPWSFWFKRSAWGLRSHTSNTQRWCSAAGAWPTFWEPCSLYHDERVTIHLRAKKCSSPLILRSFDSHLFNRLEQLLYAAQASTKDAREKNVLRLFVHLSECGSQD